MYICILYKPQHSPPPLQKKEAVHVRTFVYYYSCVLSVV